MIILNEFVYSIEMWEWFHEMKRSKLDFEKKRDSSVVVFETFMYTEDRYDLQRDYYQFNLQQLWDLVWDLFMHMSGVQSKFNVDVKYTLSDIDMELEKVYRALLWWCFAEGVPQKDFSAFDYTMIDNEKMSVNQHFRYRVYYIIKSIEKSFKNAKLQLSNYKFTDVSQMEEENEYIFKNGISDTEVKEFIVNEIRKSAAGDADEFILYTISDIQNKTMNEYHEKLCQLIRFIKFDDPDFDSKLPPGQIWQTLFKEVFDGKDEVFDTFYSSFTYQSIMYFLSDYTLNTFDIELIPIYNVFTDNNGASYAKQIFNLLDTIRIGKRIRQVIKKYEQS